MVKATPAGFETFHVLKTRPEQPPVITVPLSLDGLSVRKEASGQLSLLDDKGEVKAVSPTAIMWSASRHERVDEPDQVRTVDLQIEGTGSNQHLVLRPEFQFLSDPATVYPVTIDPAATLMTTGLDTYVSSGTPNSTHSSEGELKVGRLSGSAYRSFIQFGTSAIVNKSVYSAALYLNQKDAYSCGTSSMWIDRANAFSSNTTWTSQPAYGPMHYYSGSWSGGGATCPYTIGWRSLDVRGLAQAWATSATPVGNMALVAPDENNQDHFRSFHSAESAWPPRIEVEHSAQSTFPAPSSATAVAGNGTATISWPAATFTPQMYGVALYKEQGANNWVYTGLAQNVNGSTTSAVSTTCLTTSPTSPRSPASATAFGATWWLATSSALGSTSGCHQSGGHSRRPGGNRRPEQPRPHGRHRLPALGAATRNLPL